MKRFGAVSLLAVLLAIGAQAAPVSAHSPLAYNQKYCTAHPNAAGCSATNISAFTAAAAKAAAAAAASRACTPVGSAHCQALLQAAKNAVAIAAALAKKAGVPYAVPLLGGGGTYLAGTAGSQAVLSGVTVGSKAQTTAANSTNILPRTGGGSPVSPLGGFGLLLASILATLGFGLRRFAR